MMAQAGAILMSLGRKPDTHRGNRNKEVKLWYVVGNNSNESGNWATCKKSCETILGNNPSHYAEGGWGDLSGYWEEEEKKELDQKKMFLQAEMWFTLNLKWITQIKLSGDVTKLRMTSKASTWIIHSKCELLLIYYNFHREVNRNKVQGN